MDENSTWRIFTWQTIIDVDSCLTEVGLTWTPRYHVRGFSLGMRIKGPHKYTLKLHNINLLQCRSFSYIPNPKEQTLSISISLLRVMSPTPHITGVHSTLIEPPMNPNTRTHRIGIATFITAILTTSTLCYSIVSRATLIPFFLTLPCQPRKTP